MLVRCSREPSVHWDVFLNSFHCLGPRKLRKRPVIGAVSLLVCAWRPLEQAARVICSSQLLRQPSVFASIKSVKTWRYSFYFLSAFLHSPQRLESCIPTDTMHLLSNAFYLVLLVTARYLPMRFNSAALNRKFPADHTAMAWLHSSSAAAYPEPEAAKYLFGRDGSCAGTPFTTVALSTEQTVITSLITTETVVQVPTTVTIPHSVCIFAACCSHYVMILIINIVLWGYFSAVLDIFCNAGT